MRERSVTFYVPGAPVPQGSVVAHAHRRKDGTVYASVHYAVGSKLHRWRNAIGKAARAAWGETETYSPVTLALVFYIQRPLSHYSGLQGMIKAQYRDAVPDGVPDIDKLTRAVMDALTEVVYGDDSQVVEIAAVKRYAPLGVKPGVEVAIVALP